MGQLTFSYFQLQDTIFTNASQNSDSHQLIESVSLSLRHARDQKFTVVEYAEFPTHVHLEHLKTEVLGLPPDSFLLRLSQSQTGQPTAMILVTHTRFVRFK